MAVTIQIPTPLRPFTGGQSAVTVEADTAGAALAALVRDHPGLEKHLFGDDGKLRSFVNVYRNDEDIRHLQAGDTPLSASDTLMIVPSIAGGRP